MGPIPVLWPVTALQMAGDVVGHYSPDLASICRCVTFSSQEKKQLFFFLKRNNWMVFIMERTHFICEVRTEFLYVIWKKFGLHCSPFNMNFKTSAHAQFSQCYQTFVSRQFIFPKYQSQIKCISDIPDAQSIPCAAYWNSPFLIALLSSLSKPPLNLQRTFTRRTSGHWLWAPRRVNPLFFRYSIHSVAGSIGRAV